MLVRISVHNKITKQSTETMGVSLPDVLLPDYSFDFVFLRAVLTTASFDEKIILGYNLGRVPAGRHIPGFGALIRSLFLVSRNG